MFRSIVICPDPGLRRQCRQELAGTRLVEVLREMERYPDRVELVRILRAHAPHVIFLSVEQLTDALAIAAETERAAPGTQIVGLGQLCEPSVLLQCMRAGIREFASAPLHAAMLEESLLRLSENIDARPAATPQTAGMVVTFLPAKGGVGATTVALNISAAIARQEPGSVLLADLDTSNGLTRFLLKVDNVNSSQDALNRTDELDDELWPQLVTRVGAMDVLHSGDMHPGPHYDASCVHTLMEFLRRNYQTICLDISGRLENFEMELLAESKKIVLVCTPEAPALHMAREKLKYLERADLSSRVHVVVNRSPRRPVLTPVEIERILGKPVTATLANDYAGVQKALTEATWIGSDSELAKGMQSLATQLLEKTAKPHAEPRKRLVEYFSVRSPRFGNTQTIEKPAV